ncbi:hypothetical protein CDL12_13917 [Handroanthus impetiginosus]|uniref:Uncharacterized protein n=1 Tax=Handroanthus impetiginosus TaxID=429701 RepID=A0A2G9H7G7_9LAMI|nr:hypothetical protein CDL12_13917 [Handroanthus impetiginosus]
MLNLLLLGGKGIPLPMSLPNQLLLLMRKALTSHRMHRYFVISVSAGFVT